MAENEGRRSVLKAGRGGCFSLPSGSLWGRRRTHSKCVCFGIHSSGRQFYFWEVKALTLNFCCISPTDLEHCSKLPQGGPLCANPHSACAVVLASVVRVLIDIGTDTNGRKQKWLLLYCKDLLLLWHHVKLYQYKYKKSEFLTLVLSRHCSFWIFALDYWYWRQTYSACTRCACVCKCVCLLEWSASYPLPKVPILPGSCRNPSADVTAAADHCVKPY